MELIRFASKKSCIIKFFSKLNKNRSVIIASIAKIAKCETKKNLNGIVPTFGHNDYGIKPFSLPAVICTITVDGI